jgi:hypothetical protein
MFRQHVVILRGLITKEYIIITSIYMLNGPNIKTPKHTNPTTVALPTACVSDRRVSLVRHLLHASQRHVSRGHTTFVTTALLITVRFSRKAAYDPRIQFAFPNCRQCAALQASLATDCHYTAHPGAALRPAR